MAVTILLLGGRAPATLELARLFHAAGHRVVAAESAPWSIASASRAVAASFRIPPPAHAIDAFARALASIIERENVAFLLPTCEEIFHVAHIAEKLPKKCRIFAPSLAELERVHHKGRFVEMARAFDLAVPETRLIHSDSELAPFLSRTHHLVFKPAFSRFAAKTLIKPSPSQLRDGARPTQEQPWVAQEFIAGREFCTLSIAHNGRLTAHAAYPSEWNAGRGATIAFRAIEHPATRSWVERFVAEAGWTGQIAFDFIEKPDGAVVALECNPRITSGIHLLATDPDIAAAYLNASTPCVTPSPGARAMVGAAMVLYGLPSVRTRARWRAWRAAVRHNRDVIWRADDPKPWFVQWLALASFLADAARYRITPLEASTRDIEWNGAQVLTP